MEDTNKQVLTCPVCKCEQETELYPIVHATGDEDIKNKVMDGTLLQFKCNKCGHKTILKYDMLYEDMDRNLMIQLCNKDAVEQHDELMHKAKESFEGSLSASEGKPTHVTMRIVSEPNDLMEKVRLFESELDDRIVEMVKYLTLEHVVRDYPEYAGGKMLFASVEDHNELVMVKDGLQPMASSFPMKAYLMIESELMPKIKGETNDEFVIDQEFAKKYLLKLNLLKN